ncbi:unnamed protein product [Clonostachys solani]|uniref:Uncharacterized protein n=1 Tax=Clonostachys solani TaxID=160281 RepID=A0A9N9ZAY1_9HYPO|nr:unnamed protein product [Clonostachys solani]
MTLAGFVGLAKAIDICHDIWDAFANERINAPTRIRALVTTIGHLHGILKFLDENYQDQYPLKNQFLETLGECEEFIDNYRTLKTAQPSPGDNPLVDTLRHPWDTTLYGLDGAERRAEELSQKLVSQQQNLTIFLLAQFLKITVSNHEGAPLTTSTPSETSSEHSSKGASLGILENQTPFEIFSQGNLPHEQKLAKFHECFQLLRNRYERVTSNAAQHGRVPNLNRLQEEYQALWFFLCSHVGLPKNKQPAMPPMDKLFANPSSVSSDVRINSDRAIPIARTWSSPILTEENISKSPSTFQFRSSSTVRTTPQSTGIPHPGPAPSISSAESIILPGPAMFPEEHVASTFVSPANP